MKKSLGDIVLIILIFSFLELGASTYKWTAHVNKTEAHINEAIYLVYKCKFSDRAELSIIDFNPVGEFTNYDIELLSKYDKFIDSKKISVYEFVLFAKKEGLLELEFDTVMKTTTQDSIENTVLGRDNEEYEEFSKTKIKQKKLSINISSIKEIVKDNLIGDFKLDIKVDSNKKKAYEPFHMQVKISGNGSFNLLKEIKFDLQGVKVFSQKPIKKLKLHKNGLNGTWIQKFAFTSEKNFTIPDIQIKYFDTRSKSVKSLSSKSINVVVSKAYKKEQLLDKEVKSYQFNIEYLYYMLTFIAGFLVSKIKFKKEKISSKHEKFISKINNAKTLNELSVLLIMNHEVLFKEIIMGIEQRKITSLDKVKYEAIKIYQKSI